MTNFHIKGEAKSFILEDCWGMALKTQEGLRAIKQGKLHPANIRIWDRKFQITKTKSENGVITIAYGDGKTITATPCLVSEEEGKAVWQTADRIAGLLRNADIHVEYDADWACYTTEEFDTIGYALSEFGKPVSWTNWAVAHNWEEKRPALSCLIAAHAALWPLYYRANEVY